MMTKNQTIILAVVLILTTMALGCERSLGKRTQKEIFIESEMPAPLPMDQNHAFLNMMPQDEIHAGLNLGDMPMAQSAQLEQSLDKSPLRWTTPEGWFEKKGSGMRVATFTNDNETTPVETTIVSLAGGAGGLTSNITRWMGQINMAVPNDNELEEFIQGQERVQTTSEWSAILIDLTQLQQGTADNTPSMIAAVIDRGQSQIFVKMTGAKRSVLENLASFKSLVQSISPAE
ncbi:MAG TPA: hypothetical protein VI749_00740 [Candidatus Omnitrophota bacterium]|nr:hypothetical protein [Candidatus Omnitrophota bacterium]